MKPGDEVYIRAVISRMPEEDSRLFRVETAEGHTVVWCRPGEVVEKEDK